MTEQSFTCMACGGQFIGRKRMYCTPSCRNKLYGFNKRRAKGRTLREEISANAACNQTHICKWCDIGFKPKRAGRTDYCSRDCYFKFIKAKSDLINEMSVSHKVCRAKCVVCNERFEGRLGSLYCDDGCRIASRYEKRMFECKECGCSVETSYGDKRSAFCSNECSKRYDRRIRRKMERARLRSVKVEAVDPIKVFDRDGWRCQICGKKTPKSKRGSIDERAPELDHIVPLSVGGEHSYANTQCACRQCNARKGGTVYGQLHLFAT